jgi:N-acetylglutamate synthase-like GNAT family acetyltransferase
MIRKARIEDLNDILEVIKDAKELLRKNNSMQWQTSKYPDASIFLEDIRKGYLYVCEEDGKVGGVATLLEEPDENYHEIEGQWLNDEKYYSIHRLAVKSEYYGRGIAKQLFKYFEEITKKAGIKNIRVDTTSENSVMHHLLNIFNYQVCGKIYLKTIEEYNERIAYQKTL